MLALTNSTSASFNMKRFAVAVYDSSTRVNSVYVFEADSPIEAALKAIDMKFEEDLHNDNLDLDDTVPVQEELGECEGMIDIHAVLAAMTCICISDPISVR